MKEKIKEIISIIFIALFMAILLFAWLTEPMDEYYIQRVERRMSDYLRW